MPNSLLPQLADVLAAAVPEVQRPGLRERKKAAAMTRIQHIAVELFERHGFDKVTVEQIADAAEVSPSSVYRYFGTKEGLVLRDEYDDAVLAVAPALFARYDPWTAFARALQLLEHTHFVDDPLSARRMRIWHENPSVRAAGFTALDQMAAALAPMMHATDRYGLSLRDYQVLSASMITAFFVCLEQWYLDGATRNIAQDSLRVLELIRPGWATAAG